VSEARASGAGHVVVTGGEPLLQRDDGELTRSLGAASPPRDGGNRGGTPTRTSSAICSRLSPKTANSDPQGKWRDRHRRLRADRAPLVRLIRRFPEHQIKFVVADGDDIWDIVALVEDVGAIDPWRVLLMPEGRSASEVAAKSEMVAALCSEHGFRYTPRLHLDLFGGGRGV
jgi:7-carboxy-7-deazaguanine synthase